MNLIIEVDESEDSFGSDHSDSMPLTDDPVSVSNIHMDIYREINELNKISDPEGPILSINENDSSESSITIPIAKPSLRQFKTTV